MRRAEEKSGPGASGWGVVFTATEMFCAMVVTSVGTNYNRVRAGLSLACAAQQSLARIPLPRVPLMGGDAGPRDTFWTGGLGGDAESRG